MSGCAVVALEYTIKPQSLPMASARIVARCPVSGGLMLQFNEDEIRRRFEPFAGRMRRAELPDLMINLTRFMGLVGHCLCGIHNVLIACDGKRRKLTKNVGNL